MDTISSDYVIETTLRNVNRVLSNSLKADILILKSPMMPPIDDVVRVEVEGVVDGGRRKKNDKLVVLRRLSRESLLFFVNTIRLLNLSFPITRIPLAPYWSCQGMRSTWITILF